MTRSFLAATLAALSTLLLGAAPEAPRPATTRDVEDQGFRVRLDLSNQALAIDIREDRAFGEGSGEPEIRPTLAGSGGGMVSASMLAQKAKQFDDGLYAAVELAAQSGAGTFAGKSAMLRSLASHATSEPQRPSGGNALLVLLAACRLGKVPAEVPGPIRRMVDFAESEFLADPLRSRPLGFYTWSPALADIFRQDRMLQTELEGAGGIARVARALAADRDARATYDAYLTLCDRLTNPGASLADLRGAVAALEAGREVPGKGVAFFPASRSNEGDLVMKLFAGRPIPEGFSLVEEMIRRIRAGQLDLRPTARSGWYDYQSWALEPLVAPEKTPEAARIRFGDEYRKQLLDLFRGILALTRETHVKQLEIPAPGSAPPPSEKPVILVIRPDLPAEPLVTYYRRRAESYDFIRTALLATFGRDGLESMRRQTASGPASTSLATELDATRGLFLGAAESTARLLGMPADATLDANVSAFRAWAGAAGDDPDLGSDARMMVPVFHDLGRNKTKVWVVLGWSSRPAIVSYLRAPAYQVTRGGRAAEGQAAPRVEFESSYPDLPYPVSAEVYVDEVLDRDQFRKVCDTHKTRKAILAHLK